MQSQVRQWVQVSTQLRKNLQDWALAVNNQNVPEVVALYHPKARLFPTFGALKVGHKEIENYITKAAAKSVTINYRSVSYNTEENLVEGEYTFELADGKIIPADFALKFDSKNVIVEHASAPVKTSTWTLKNEVSICTLLTSATVKSILKETTIHTTISKKEVPEL